LKYRQTIAQENGRHLKYQKKIQGSHVWLPHLAQFLSEIAQEN
jgi:hypothetical protein